MLQPHERTKLKPRSRLCCFLGYGFEHKGYRCNDPISKSLRVSWLVIFWEHKSFFSPSNSTDYLSLAPLESSTQHMELSPPQYVDTLTRRSTRIKTKSDGSVERYKARLVTRGFTQEYDIDYEETFTRVTHITSVFLLRKALYGLKQAPRAWYANFHSTLGQLGFTTRSYDSALFIKKSSAGIILLLLYVVDMITTGDNIYGIQKSVVSRSSSEFKYRILVDTTAELVWLRWLLSDMGVSFSSSTPIHCHSQSAIQITHNDVFHERTKRIEIYCHFVRHHFLQQTLSLSSVISVDQTADLFTKTHPLGRFHALVSKLNLVSSVISYAVHLASDPTDRRSTIGYYFFLGSSFISWRLTSIDQTADLFTKTHPPGRFYALMSKLNLVSSEPP
ncbi:Retrovirus-related Pol polyprotein from transposon RE1-like protein [Drosera capensis]